MSFPTALEVREFCPEDLMTDGITDSTINQKIEEAKIEVLEAVAHIYDSDQITESNLPPIIRLAILKNAVGSTLIAEFPMKKGKVELGRIYKADSEKAIKNIISGKRRFGELASQKSKNTRQSTYTSVRDSLTDTRAKNFISAYKLL